MAGGTGDRTARGFGGVARRWGLLLGPLVVSALVQFEAVQRIEGFWAVVADLIAPVWVLSIVTAAGRLRAAVRARDLEHRPRTPLGKVAADKRWAIRATWAATVGACVVLICSWTREWTRFGPWPDAVLYGVLVVGTLALLVLPLWWLRHPLLTAVDRAVTESRVTRHLDGYLFATKDPRWPVAAGLAAVTLILGLAVLGRFDDLLAGMHASGEAGAGITDLADTWTFDLSTKTDAVIGAVRTWQDFSVGAGPEFASGRAIVLAHVLVDSLLVIPAYLVLGGVLMLWMRHRLGAEEDGDEEARRVSRASELLTLFGLALLGGLVAVDLIENFFTWFVVERAWSGGAVTELNARILWLASLGKTVAMGILVVSAVLILGLRRVAWPLLRTVMALRAHLAVILLLWAVLYVPHQFSDVVRRWTAAECLIAVGLASLLAMLLSRFSRAALRVQRRDHEVLESGAGLPPQEVRVPRLGTQPLRSVVVAVLLGAAGLQVLLDVATPLGVGRGLLIPAGIVVGLWVLGIPLPSFPLRRQLGSVPHAVESSLPGIIGGAVFLLLGLTVVRAAVGHLLSAGREEWWLALALLPMGIGIWRLHRRSYAAIGGMEFAATAAILIYGGVLIAGGDPELNPTSLVVIGIAITYGAFPFFFSHRSAALLSRIISRTRLHRMGFHPVITTGVTGTAALVAAVVWRPIAVAGYLGAIGVLLLAAVLIAFIGDRAVRFAERTRPPKILAAFGISRTPVFLFVAAWYFLAPLTVSESAYDIPVQGGAGHEVAGIGVDAVWERWAERNLSGPVRVPAGRRPAVPLLLISSSGGGARAAVWTGFVTDCILGTEPDAAGVPCARRAGDAGAAGRVAVMSGVSGGALGLASYAAYQDAVPGQPRLAESDLWVEQTLGDDYLAAPLAWGLFVDIPRELLGFSDTIRDRGEILEQAWEEAWDRAGISGGLDTGIFELWYRNPDVPPLVFSGTSVADACRFNSSVLDVAVPDETGNCRSLAPFDGTGLMSGAALPATHDLADFLCPGEDVRLSTAVNLSSRYPVLAPSGRVPARPGCGHDETREVRVVDGGYLEGSGAGTLLDLWRALEPIVEQHNASGGVCVVPFAVHIDNGYESSRPVGTSGSNEFTAPVVAYTGAQTGRLAAARAGLALAFDQPLMVAGEPITVTATYGGVGASIESRFARVTTWAHPGVQAPLGWTLSQASIDDLRDQLLIEQNAAQLREIAAWLSGSLECSG